MSRLTVEFPPQFTKALEELAAEAKTSKTEILRRAVTSYKVLQDADRANNEIVIIDRSANKETRLILP